MSHSLDNKIYNLINEWQVLIIIDECHTKWMSHLKIKPTFD